MSDEINDIPFFEIVSSDQLEVVMMMMVQEMDVETVDTIQKAKSAEEKGSDFGMVRNYLYIYSFFVITIVTLTTFIAILRILLNTFPGNSKAHISE
jgi:hypothetical protein